MDIFLYDINILKLHFFLNKSLDFLIKIFYLVCSLGKSIGSTSKRRNFQQALCIEISNFVKQGVMSVIFN